MRNIEVKDNPIIECLICNSFAFKPIKPPRVKKTFKDVVGTKYCHCGATGFYTIPYFEDSEPQPFGQYDYEE